VQDNDNKHCIMYVNSVFGVITSEHCWYINVLFIYSKTSELQILRYIVFVFSFQFLSV
jgi:hypothetical protein